MEEESLKTIHILITAIGSVLGGMLGAYLIVLFRKSRPKTVSIYEVNNEMNRGDDKERRGESMHGKGVAVTIDNRPLWQWTNRQCGSEKHSLIYGPYSHDLNLPGKYRIEYLIRGNGFRPSDNETILVLDVTGIVYKRVPLYNDDGTPILDKNKIIKTKTYTDSFRVYGSRKLKKSELSNGKWNKFFVDVYSNGSANLYEFRAREYNDYKIKNDEEVYFDSITVKKIN